MEWYTYLKTQSNKSEIVIYSVSFVSLTKLLLLHYRCRCWSFGVVISTHICVVFVIVGEWKGARSHIAYANSPCTFLVKIDPTYKHWLDHHISTFLKLGMQCYADTCSCSKFTYLQSHFYWAVCLFGHFKIGKTKANQGQWFKLTRKADP